MKKTNNNTSKILNVSYMITRVLEIGTYALIGILSLVAIVFLVIPANTLVVSLDQMSDFELMVNQISVAISSLGLTGSITLKWLVVLGTTFLVFSLLFAGVFLYHLRHIIDLVKEDKPFLYENANRLYFMGKLTIVASILIPIVSSLFLMYAFNLVGFQEADINFMPNITYLFVGFLLIVLGSVFEKGAYLQSEYDQTV